ncbi:hypothetical protein QNI16_20575 [Cytophagaceae bacterium YF14B1]|uniref:Uncharacterized protein n=1 Tax=Xanthocytophaga flava TaxID=3048013 RepID=A0AAE3U7G2_9BACT|nr:hypothetical protein [Xanthocytophaga flavus]MDJ1482909.1 hypothetical protein [Xanthocytophaga flavus]
METIQMHEGSLTEKIDLARLEHNLAVKIITAYIVQFVAMATTVVALVKMLFRRKLLV